MNPTTVASRASAAAVAAVAGFSSWNHITAVAHGAGEPAAVAAVLPLSIDGLIVVATLAMLEDKRADRAPRTSARVALGFGVIATLAANIASAEPTVTARLVAAVPAVAFLAAVEVLARSGRPLAPAVTPDVTPVTAGVTPRRRQPKPPSAVKVERAAARMPGATAAAVAAKAGVSESTARRYLPAPPDANLASANGHQPAQTTPVLNGGTPS